jgi:hypothetical protein
MTPGRARSAGRGGSGIVVGPRSRGQDESTAPKLRRRSGIVRAMDAQTAAVVATIAAAISALTALVSLAVAAAFGWAQLHASDPKVAVMTSTAFRYGGPTLGPAFYLVTVANRGVVPVTVTSVGFELRGRGESFVSMDSRDPSGARSVPKPLGPGESTEVVFELADLGRVQREKGITRPFALTAIGDRHRGKRVDGKSLATWGR